MKRTLNILLVLIYSLSINAVRIDLLTVGGNGDGVTINTTVIQNQIDKLSEAGGGTLFFPAGTYLTGAMVLKNNITLDLEAGATIRFTDQFKAYTPFVEMRYEGVVMKSFCPMIYAYKQKNITIKGEGKIDGNGKKWWYATFANEGAHKDEALIEELKEFRALWLKENPTLTIEAQSDWKRTLEKQFFRPPLFQSYLCKNIKIEGVTFVNSPFWTINPEFCENVSIQGITINNPDAPNTDGINPSSCKNVLISNCHITVGDDCITLKSGRDLQGRQYATPCENISITNCTMLSGHGGVVIGSEMSGDVRKVSISNCVFDGTDRGIRIKSTRGRGGIVEEIRISNIVMKNIAREAITFNLFYSNMPLEPVSERTPIFRNIHVSGVTGSNINMACTVLGIEESSISNISFTDINMQAKTGFEFNKVSDVTLHNVRIDTELGAAFKISESTNLHLTNVSNATPIANQPLLKIDDVNKIFIQSCFPAKGASSFIELGGATSDQIVLMNNYLNNLPKSILKLKSLNPKAILVEK